MYSDSAVESDTQKNYFLEAPLGAKPAAGATPDVMNVWQSKADDYSIVQCAMLYGETWVHFVYKTDNRFQSIRISSGNSSVTKGFHFLKLI